MKVSEIERIETTKHFFKLSWKMTNWCNYNCPYCYLPNKPTKPNVEHLIDIAKSINNLVDKEFELHLIGGEVGWFDLVKLLSNVTTDNYIKTTIVSNFSAPLSKWVSCIENLPEVTILASLHLSQCNPNKFIEKALKLKKNVRIKCVVNDENLKTYQNLFKGIEKEIRIQPTIQRDTNDNLFNVSQDVIDYVNYINNLNKKFTMYKVLANGQTFEFRNNAELLANIEDGLNLKGFHCSAGLNNLRIEPDGTLLRSSCGNRIVLGNVLTKYKLPKENIICNSNRNCVACDNTVMWK